MMKYLAAIKNIFLEFLGLIDRIENPWENTHKAFTKPEYKRRYIMAQYCNIYNSPNINNVYIQIMR